MVTVRPIAPGDVDACDAVVASLPYHFADEQGREDCAAAVRSQPGLVAEDDGDIVGFLTYEPRFDASAEITWMAVRADRRRAGIGRRLLARLTDDLVADGRRLLVVLTVSPSDGPDDIPDGYQATRAFYEANGFVLARDFAGYWNSDTPVLMARMLSPQHAHGSLDTSTRAAGTSGSS